MKYISSKATALFLLIGTLKLGLSYRLNLFFCIDDIYLKAYCSILSGSSERSKLFSSNLEIYTTDSKLLRYDKLLIRALLCVFATSI